MLSRVATSTGSLVGMSAVALVLLTGCSRSAGEASLVPTPSQSPSRSAPEVGTVDQSPPPVPTGSPSPAPQADVASDEPGSALPSPGTADQQEAAQGEGVLGEPALTVTGFRAGSAEGYERVVVDLGGQGQPGWLAGYDPDPTADGSGEPIELAGDAALLVTVQGLGDPQQSGVPEYDGARRISPEASGPIREIYYGSVFEGQAQVYLGLDAERPFRVFRLSDPTRLVIDVATG